MIEKKSMDHSKNDVMKRGWLSESFEFWAGYLSMFCKERLHVAAVVRPVPRKCGFPHAYSSQQREPAFACNGSLLEIKSWMILVWILRSVVDHHTHGAKSDHSDICSSCWAGAYSEPPCTEEARAHHDAQVKVG